MMQADALGTVHPTVDAGAARIVSLVPSVTELLCDLGLAGSIVGRTGFCIHPAETVRGIAKVGGTKDVNIEKIRKLAPTHVVVNIDENEKPTVDALAAFVPNVVVTHPLAPRDNLALYRLLGGIFNADDAVERLCAAFEAEYAALAALPPVPPRRVLYCIWQDPWMTVARDTYIAGMLALAGMQQWQATGDARRYPVFTWSDVLAAEIDEVLLSSEPYRFTEDHVDAIERQTGKPAGLVDGEMMSWYGSRAIEGLRYLRKMREES